MTPEDLAKLHKRAFSDMRAWSASEFARLLEQTGVFVLGEPRCFVLIRVVADEAEVLTVATHPDHQRKGLARTALKDSETLAVRSGAVEIFLEVAENNAPAMSLYEGAGYLRVGQRAGYYNSKHGDAVTAFILRKQLIGA